MPADISASLKDWSTTAASNQPQGSTLIGANLDDNLRAMQVAIRQDRATRASVASAATTDIGAVDAGSLDISGTTTITSFGTVSIGIRKVLTFTGILTLTYHATNMILPGGASITTAVGDVAEFESRGGGMWKCLSYTKANGTPVTISTLLADGAVATPSLAFASETTLGLYRHSAAVMGIGIGSTRQAAFDANGMVVRIGADTNAIRIGNGGSLVSQGINVRGDIGVGGGVGVNGFGTNGSAFLTSGAPAASSAHLQTADTSAGSALSWFIYSYNSGGAAFKVSTQGQVYSDSGTTMTTPADYAEMFEWADGNPDAEDRVGYSVALDGHRIRIAGPGDTPIGVVSGNPAVLGDAGDLRWVDQYLRDEFNRPVMEDAELIVWRDPSTEAPGPDGEVEEVLGELRTYYADTLPAGTIPPDDARREQVRRRVVNPAYVPGSDYVPRRDRKEWSAVGLMGKLRLRNGQEVAPRWIKMRDVSANVSEWLVI